MKRYRGARRYALRPRILERHRAVVDRLARRVVAQIRDEVAVPLELEHFSRRGAAERGLDVGGDDALAVRIEIVEPVALDGLGAVVVDVVAGDHGCMRNGLPPAPSAPRPAGGASRETAPRTADRRAALPPGARARPRANGCCPAPCAHRRPACRSALPDRRCNGPRRPCRRHPSPRRRSARCTRSAGALRRPGRGGNSPAARPPGSRRARSTARARTAARACRAPAAADDSARSSFPPAPSG